MILWYFNKDQTMTWETMYDLFPDGTIITVIRIQDKKAWVCKSWMASLPSFAYLAHHAWQDLKLKVLTQAKDLCQTRHFHSHYIVPNCWSCKWSKVDGQCFAEQYLLWHTYFYFTVWIRKGFQNWKLLFKIFASHLQYWQMCKLYLHLFLLHCVNNNNGQKKNLMTKIWFLYICFHLKCSNCAKFGFGSFTGPTIWYSTVWIEMFGTGPWLGKEPWGWGPAKHGVLALLCLTGPSGSF